MAEETPAEQAIVFHIEVPGAVGLPKPEVTYVQIAGLGLEEDYASEAQVEESTEPGPWLFQSLEALAEANRLKAEAEAAQGKKKKDDKEDSRPQSIDPPSAVCRIARPCKLPAERQRLLDSACAPLRLRLFRQGPVPLELGQVQLELAPLIHESASLDVDLELQWSEALLEELKTEFEERVAAEAAAAEAAKAESGEADAEAPAEVQEEPPQFVPPPVGRLLLKISTAAPMGRILCPEDLHDWAVLTTKIEGIYQLPVKLLEAGGPLPELGTAEGVLEAHPLCYAVRLLGCDFNGGQLFLPHVELPPAAAEGAAPEAPEAEPEVPDSPSQADISFDIGTEEFQEGLLRAGYPAARTDGPAVFSFLCRPRTGLGGRIGLHDFLRLLEIKLPAGPEKLLELHGALVEKHESLEMAFSALDSAAEGALTMESLAAGIEELGLSKSPEEVEALFVALDTGRSGSISREDLRLLSLAKRKNDLEMAQQAVKWLVSACGSLSKLLEQMDEQMTGSVSKEAFLATAQRLGLSDGVELAFSFAQQMEGAETLSHQSFFSLQALESVEHLPSMLVKLQELLLHGAPELPGQAGQLALQRLKDDEEMVESITCSEFIAGLSQLEGAPLSVPSAQCLFFLLDGANVGTLDALAFSSLPNLNAAAMWRRLSDCRRFIEAGFGEIDPKAFRALFEGPGEDVFQEAEENLPHVLFETNEQVAYRGREWLQRLLNTLGDERGRDPVKDSLSKTGGAWLYMFPTVQGQDLVDYKEISDPTASSHGKLARWHQGHGFVDLRRLAAPGTNGQGPMLEFRAYLTQVTQLPGANEFPEAEWSTAYMPCRSYVKGVIRLDRPLQRLCPRDVRPALQPSGEAYIPPPPPKRPPPTVNEDLEKEAAVLIARLSFDFARWCYDSGYIESKIVGPGGELSPNPVLGKKGVARRAFLQWMEQDPEGGTSLKDLGNALRPAVVRLMRAENKNGPACGLSGNENDAKYTYLRDYISRHLFRALNSEVEKHRRLHDERIWRSPCAENAQDADAVDSWQKQDATLKRLTVEYELLGDWQRAREVYEDWLALEANVENGQAWFSFARFLMRSGQNQLDAERVLRYAISLRTEDEGPDFQEVAFLASLLQTHRLPSSLDEGGRSARFQAAMAMMEAYADRNAFEPMPMHIIFLLLAVEAEALRQMAAADASEQALQLAEDSDRMTAEAAKYLELARASPKKWQGTLEATPSFPELTTLVAKESLNRGRPEVPEAPETPAAWLPSSEPTPSFVDAQSLRSAPDPDDAMALQVIDLLLHFGLSDLPGFLLEEAVQAYGYLSPATVKSERCQLQRVKVAMLTKDWNKAEQLFSDLFQRRGGDRLPEAHALLGECRYRAARDANSSSAGYDSALAEFEAALCFMTEETSGFKEDPVLQLRVGSILHLKSEEQNFSDRMLAERAVKHYKKSAMAAPTAEAWKNIGLCRYRRVKYETTARKEKKLREAMQYFYEANALDRERPDTLAWLSICAVELGEVQRAKQGFRQLMQFEERLASPVALELAEVLLRFSNERRAAEWQGERGRLVQDGRYAKEAAMLSKVLLGRSESGPARCILAWSKFLQGEHGAAAGEFCAALTGLLTEKPQMLEEAAYMARHCAALIPGEPQLSALVEEAIAIASEPQPEESSGLGDDADEAEPDAATMETPRLDDLLNA